MSRGLSPAQLAAAAGRHYQVAPLVELYFDAGTLRFTLAPFNIVVGANTYLATGPFGSIKEVAEASSSLEGMEFGLSGVDSLTATLREAQSRGQDIGDAAVLARYARAHQRHAWPIYQGTNAIVQLYTDTRALPRLLRRAVLAGSTRLPPLKGLIVSQLTGRRPAWPTAAP